MIERVVLLSGPICSGKSTLAQGLANQFGMDIFKTREVLQTRINNELSNNRKVLQSSGERLDKSTKGAWVRDEITKRLYNTPENATIVVDSVRIFEQIDTIRKAFGPKVIHVHLTAPKDELEKRYKQRQKTKQEGTRDYADARSNSTEKQVESLADKADVVINSKQCTPEDVLVRVTSHINIRHGRGRGYVDVLVGGQYGSEGKGQIAAYLSPEYDLLVRVGGPNAGHTVYEEPKPSIHHQLPSGTGRSKARLLIGPGATLNIYDLLQEIADYGVDVNRLSIDPNAMIISKADRERETEGVERIGSTGRGVGAAAARRILGRLDYPHPALAGNSPELKPYVRKAIDVLKEAYLSDCRILLEGTQGTGLSLYHGFYPHVTSRDTTVSGCISEAGISWNKVRKAIMVCRTHPIRVKDGAKGTSGPISQPITWAEVSRRSGISESVLRKSELTTTTKKLRRVGEFDWGLLEKATLLNSPTDIALTFTDYLHPVNGKAKRFEQLHHETINFIQEIERVSGARVSLISTGFNYRSIIDRRSW